ncbi:hypothetical protein ACFSHT_28045 [Paraburkholderia silviterrae]|uniref:hypothetical protein n=1 Tax=Paraburkholderia silviterrae TaxID=2528715 RepID=UPI001404B567|nr:hypothetical protein [Paraburkholderia silviterrae]
MVFAISLARSMITLRDSMDSAPIGAAAFGGRPRLRGGVATAVSGFLVVGAVIDDSHRSGKYPQSTFKI